MQRTIKEAKMVAVRIISESSLAFGQTTGVKKLIVDELIVRNGSPPRLRRGGRDINKISQRVLCWSGWGGQTGGDVEVMPN